MRRKQMFILLCIATGSVYLIFSGEMNIHSGSTLINTENKYTTSSEQLTGKLYISPGGSKKEVLFTLQKAKYSIDIRGYQITDKDLIQLLINKQKTGVKVRVILENSMHGNETKDYLGFYKQTKGSGIEVQTDEGLGTNYVHAKTFIIDKQTFIVSTANSTYPGFLGNRDYRFISNQATTAAVLSNVFDHDWQKQQWTQQLPSTLRICPFNCRSSIISFLQKATTHIDIQAQYLEDKEIIHLLQEKVHQGVQIKLIFGKYQEDILPDELKKSARLQANPNVHAKNILIDNKELYVGSMNLSANAIDNNREIGIVSTDKYIIQSFTNQFTEDRTSNAVPYK